MHRLIYRFIKVSGRGSNPNERTRERVHIYMNPPRLGIILCFVREGNHIISCWIRKKVFANLHNPPLYWPLFKELEQLSLPLSSSHHSHNLGSFSSILSCVDVDSSTSVAGKWDLITLYSNDIFLEDLIVHFHLLYGLSTHGVGHMLPPIWVIRPMNRKSILKTSILFSCPTHAMYLNM